MEEEVTSPGSRFLHPADDLQVIVNDAAMEYYDAAPSLLLLYLRAIRGTL